MLGEGAGGVRKIYITGCAHSGTTMLLGLMHAYGVPVVPFEVTIYKCHNQKCPYRQEKLSALNTAEKKIRQYSELGFDKLPICMAKTHLSLSHDPKLKGVPANFELPIREIRVSAGAGFIYPLCGKMRTMPGLPTNPCGENVDIDEDGNTVGLF